MQCFTVAVAGGSGTADTGRKTARKLRAQAPIVQRRRKPARIARPPAPSPPSPLGQPPNARQASAVEAQPAASDAKGAGQAGSVPPNARESRAGDSRRTAPKRKERAKSAPASVRQSPQREEAKRKGGAAAAGTRHARQAPASEGQPRAETADRAEEPPAPDKSRERRPPRRRRARTAKQNANRSFAAYMEEISSTSLLQQQEVSTLAADIRDGMHVETMQRSLTDKHGRRPTLPELSVALGRPPNAVRVALLRGTAAKNRLVAANLRLVTSVTRKIRSNRPTDSGGLTLDDMIQEGSVGLIRAAEKFDASRGYKFSTYATWWIRASVLRAITSQSRAIRVPSTVVDDYARIKKEFARQAAAGTFSPAEKDVAAALGITVAKLRFVVHVVTRAPASLDLDVGNSDGHRSSLVELIEGDDKVEQRLVDQMRRKELDRTLVRLLRPMERAAIRLRFGLDDGMPRTLREIGGVLGLSKERVRQLTFGALVKLNTPEMRETLTEYLD